MALRGLGDTGALPKVNSTRTPQITSVSVPVGQLAQSYSADVGRVCHEQTGLAARLKRIEGLARGIECMVAEDGYSIDVLTAAAPPDRSVRDAHIARAKET